MNRRHRQTDCHFDLICVLSRLWRFRVDSDATTIKQTSNTRNWGATTFTFTFTLPFTSIEKPDNAADDNALFWPSSVDELSAAWVARLEVVGRSRRYRCEFREFAYRRCRRCCCYCCCCCQFVYWIIQFARTQQKTQATNLIVSQQIFG